MFLNVSNGDVSTLRVANGTNFGDPVSSRGLKILVPFRVGSPDGLADGGMAGDRNQSNKYACKKFDILPKLKTSFSS